jgi:hypothetical protein
MSRGLICLAIMLFVLYLITVFITYDWFWMYDMRPADRFFLVLISSLFGGIAFLGGWDNH